MFRKLELLKNIGKTVMLSLLLFAALSVSSSLVGYHGPAAQNAPSAREMTAAVMLVCLLNAAVLAFVAVRSKWTGWRLVAGLFLLHFGISTFLSQIEALVFLKVLVNIVSLEMIACTSLQGLILAALTAPITALVFGKLKKTADTVESKRADGPFLGRQLMGRLLLIGLVYTVVYFLFGYFVAWQSPAVRAYYHGLEAPMWMPLFQLARGVIWGLLALIVVKMINGPFWESGLAAGLMFSVWMGSGLLIPGNPVMPDAVRMAHFVEITGSNMLFGWLAVAILNRGRGKSRKLTTENAA